MSQEFDAETITLGIGEHKPLPVLDLKTISISNRDCLSYKFLKENELWILAKKACFSEILIQTKKGNIKRYHVFIITKHEQLKYQTMAQEASKIGVDAKWNGNVLHVTGKIHKIEDYFSIHGLKDQLKEKGIFTIELTKGVWTQLVTRIYQELHQNYVDLFRCLPEGMHIVCTVSESNRPSKELLTRLMEKYKISFIYSADDSFKKNYQAKLKFFQLSKADGSYFDLGLENLNTNLDQLFEKNSLANLLGSNSIFLQNEKLNFGLLAEPEIIFTLGEEVEVALGEETPFQATSPDGKNVNLEWKFTGLIFKFKLVKLGEKYQLHYKISYQKSNSADNSAASSQQQTKEESTLYLKSGESLKLFEIGLVTRDSSTVGIPFISRIPLLGGAFKQKKESEIFKKVSGHFLLEEMPE